MDVRIGALFVSRNFLRAKGRFGIILCLAIVSAVWFEGCARNGEEVVRGHQAAAEQGDAEAQYSLAVLYANGEGVEQDSEAAARWFHAAAEQGNEGAPFNLGVLYANGEGVVQEHAAADRWYRAAAELGADIVKTAFPTGASAEEFKDIVDACFVPVIVLGGAAMGDDEALLSMVKKAIDGGASGIAVGRNVWQHPNPQGIAKALYAVVHDDASVESAVKLVSS